MRLWPFRRRYYPPTDAAVAIVHSLANEPERWSICEDGDALVHDSGVLVGTEGYTWKPNLKGEPDSNGDLVSEAIDRWVAAKLSQPQKKTDGGEVSQVTHEAGAGESFGNNTQEG